MRAEITTPLRGVGVGVGGNHFRKENIKHPRPVHPAKGGRPMLLALSLSKISFYILHDTTAFFNAYHLLIRFDKNIKRKYKTPYTFESIMKFQGRRTAGLAG